MSTINKDLTVLWVHCSAKLFEDSLSSRLGYALIDMLKSKHDQVQVIERDTTYIPHLDFDTIQKFVTGCEEWQDTLSATLVDELLQADVVVVSTPMWNFNIPSSLKAWIDHIVVKNQTYKYTPEGIKGLVQAKHVIVNVTSGGAYETNSPYDNITNYMNTIFHFLGVKDVQIVWTDNTGRGNADELMAKTTEAFKHLKALN